MPLRADFWTVDDAIDYAVANGAEVIHIANLEDPGERPALLLWSLPLSNDHHPYPDLAQAEATFNQMRAITASLEAAAAAGVIPVSAVGNRAGLMQSNFFGARPEPIPAGRERGAPCGGKVWQYV